MVLAIGLGIAASVQATAPEYSLDIQRQHLPSALNALSNQTGLQILLVEVVPAYPLVGPLRGRFTADAAITQLLETTGFSFVRSDERTIVIAAPKTIGARKQTAANIVVDSTRAASEDRMRVTPDSAGHSLSPTEEIIVTAQKYPERLQDVPIAMSVASGEELDASTARGVTEELNMIAGVSALTLAASGGNTVLSMRGVSATGANFTGSSPIAYYLDFVPFALIKSAYVPDVNPYDLERIEMLRGPQGTLYGASAQNGVVRVLTHAADPSAFEFKARSSVSATEHGGNSSRVDSTINVPIVPESLAVRLVGGYQRSGGWIDRPRQADANEGDIRNVRLRVDAKPTEALSLGLLSWNSWTNYDASPASANGRTHPSLIDDPIDVDFHITGFKAELKFDDISLSSATGHLDYSSRSNADYALLGLPDTLLTTRLKSDSFYQELMAQSSDAGGWRWSIGAMYRDAKDRLYQFRRQYAQPTDYLDSSRSMAVFGELTRRLLDGRFEITGGLRYFEDDVSSREISRGTIVTVSRDELVYSEARFHKLSPRAVFTWHVDANSLAYYASYAEGFRSGFPQNGSVIATAPQFGPLESDNLKNYELGIKRWALDGRLSLQAAAFYIEWDDIQQQLSVNVGTQTDPVNVSTMVNGASASGPGVELALDTEPIDGLTLGLNASWNDLTLNEAVLSRGLVLFDDGDRLNTSPEYVIGASAEYGVPLKDNFRLRLWLSANYTSALALHALSGGERRVATGNTILTSRSGIAIDAGDHWSAVLFVDNLTNEMGTPIRNANLPAAFDTSLRPRTVGIQVECRF